MRGSIQQRQRWQDQACPPVKDAGNLNFVQNVIRPASGPVGRCNRLCLGQGRHVLLQLRQGGGCLLVLAPLCRL